ncbi:MAG: SEL1-like repeat protein [Treponema sp.]|nr:SEL1-like repeat protein [Treponema sp.]
MKICSKCGEKFESGKFCKYCGGALVDEVGESQKKICSNCGAELSASTKFCPKCGTKVSAESSDKTLMVKEFNEIDVEHLGKYNLLTLVWGRLNSPLELNDKFDDFIMNNYGMDKLLAEEEKSHDVNLQFYIVICYENGIGCDEDEHKAFECCEKSAEQGNAWGQYLLGRCYRLGTGCDKDEHMAFEWYKKSAEQGNAIGQRCLGDCYRFGIGCKKDEDKAFEWYKKSAKQGNAAAQKSLGDCYYYGNGCEKDEEKDFKWYKESRRAGI